MVTPTAVRSEFRTYERKGKKELLHMKTRNGFTIIEMVIVIAIIGILAAVLIPTYGNVVARANESAAMQTARSTMTDWLSTAISSAGVPTSGNDANGNPFYAAYFEVESGSGTLYQFRYTAGGLERTDMDRGQYISFTGIGAEGLPESGRPQTVERVYLTTPAKSSGFDAETYAVAVYRQVVGTGAKQSVNYYVKYPADSAYACGGADVYAAVSGKTVVFTKSGADYVASYLDGTADLNAAAALAWTNPAGAAAAPLPAATEESGPEPTLDKLVFTLLADGTGYSVKAASTDISGAVVIPKTYNELPVKEIGGFYNPYYGLLDSHTEITSIIIPDGVTMIGSQAFMGCWYLTSIELPASITSIGDGAFYDCKALTSIELPAGVTYIGDNAFYGCKALTSIEIPDGVTSIGIKAFAECNSLTAISVSSANGSYTTVDGVLYNKDMTSLIVYPQGKRNTSFEIPSGVTSIESNAFYHCWGLESVEIPAGVTSIGENAFKDCGNLTSIEIPEGVTEIKEGVFRACTRLTSVVIPDGVTKINGNAFEKCVNLMSLDLPASVTYMSRPFYVDRLASINYPGTIEQWEAIFHGSFRWTDDNSHPVVHCTDGDITL
ncbi:MAG: leucine-rich repeat protein [Oscillospiraceae bacterium]|nr:leucine-rich repeat protein [Oscillospiraceae bacterium]